MSHLQSLLDHEHQSALDLRNKIQSAKTAWEQLCAHDMLGCTPYTVDLELENAHRNLLQEFRKRVHTVLAENRQVTFPGKFLEEALGVGGTSPDEIWSRWDGAKVIRHRDVVLGDMDKAEWQHAVRVAAHFLRDALRLHILSKSHRPDQSAQHQCELVIRCTLYGRDEADEHFLRTPDNLDFISIQSLHTTLRVIEGIHKGFSALPPIIIPSVLNPPRGQVCDTGAIYRWHQTGNGSVPEVRIMTGQRIVLRFSSARVLQETKKHLLPLIGL